MKYNPALLQDSVNKSLEFLEQGKLRGPHVSGEFELDQVNNITLEQTIAIFYLTNRFQVAIQKYITDDIKMWLEQKSGMQGAAKCVTDVLTTF